MKKLISTILLATMISAPALADCDLKTGITPNADGSYRYSGDCHLAVGQMKQELSVAQKQVADLNLAIVKKDEALGIADQRIMDMRDSLYKMDDKLNSFDSFKKNNEVLYFLGGVVFTGLAVWGAGQLSHH